jgi:hypothetical protein
MEPTQRGLHFVGSLPQFPDCEAAFAWQNGELAGRVRQLTGGETGARTQWFVPLVKEIKQLPQIRVVKDGDWTSYDDTDRLAARRGARLTADRIPLRIAEYAAKELAALRAAGTPATRELPLQVGVPGHLDMALFIFGPAGLPRHAGAFRAAVAGQLAALCGTAQERERLVFQLEVPAALIAVASVPAPLRPPVARAMARAVARQAAAAPAGTRFGVHLCLGDLGHRAARHLRSAAPLVALAAALVRHWPAGRPLEYLHLPLTGGERPPSTDPAFYAPLARLRLPDGTRLVAGIAHEEAAAQDQAAVRDLVERAVGRRVDIAAPCGLGRRTPPEAERAVEAMRRLTED